MDAFNRKEKKIGKNYLKEFYDHSFIVLIASKNNLFYILLLLLFY